MFRHIAPKKRQMCLLASFFSSLFCHSFGRIMFIIIPAVLVIIHV